MSVSLAPEERASAAASESVLNLAPHASTTRLNRFFRQLFVRRFRDLSGGQIVLHDADGEHRCGDDPDAGFAFVRVHDSRFYRMLALGGCLGAAEAYIRGYWDCDDLAAPMRIFAKQLDDMEAVESRAARALRPLRRGLNWLKRNTRAGSARNISAHYDLGNDFFELMLDPTMTYSAGVFTHPDATMQEASEAKYDRIAQKLQLTADDHVVEIGCGWGGFAEHAASQYGCRITATTISREQFEYAKRRVENAGLQDRVQVVMQDYRDLEGRYDKLVSIEMVEAVGERYLRRYLGRCSELLKSHGAGVIQAITMPDYRFDDYRQQVDFIQRYVFPGGFLPSLSSITQALRSGVSLQLSEVDDITPHYAETLAKWREAFWRRIDDVRELGYDERFVRIWNYYLCYCEAGFREHQIGVHQLTLAKPGFRRSAY